MLLLRLVGLHLMTLLAVHASLGTVPTLYTAQQCTRSHTCTTLSTFTQSSMPSLAMRCPGDLPPGSFGV